MRDYIDSGTYDHVVAKRQAMVEHMTPSARASHFPTLYAKPLPIEHTSEASRQTIIGLQAKNAELRAVIAALRKDNERLILENAKWHSAVVVPADVKDSSIADVIATFCRALDIAGYRAGKVPCTVDLLKGPRRSRPFARPRHVAMWLCKQLCSHASSPMIAQAFGNRDHTTVLHAFHKAPNIMRDHPVLRSVACAVLAAFEKKEGPA